MISHGKVGTQAYGQMWRISCNEIGISNIEAQACLMRTYATEYPLLPYFFIKNANKTCDDRVIYAILYLAYANLKKQVKFCVWRV